MGVKTASSCSVKLKHPMRHSSFSTVYMEIARQDYPSMENSTEPSFILIGDQFLGGT